MDNKTPYIIRPAEPQDVPAIREIYNHYVLNTTITFETVPLSLDEMTQRIKNIAAHCPCFVCEEAGEITGFCYVHPWKDRAAYCHTYETTIYLRPEQKHRGLGNEMMQRLIAACRKAGYRALIACITEENKESCEFHKRIGFKQVSYFEQVGRKFDRWLDVVDYELLLADETLS